MRINKIIGAVRSPENLDARNKIKSLNFIKNYLLSMKVRGKIWQEYYDSVDIRIKKIMEASDE